MASLAWPHSLAPFGRCAAGTASRVTIHRQTYRYCLLGRYIVKEEDNSPSPHKDSLDQRKSGQSFRLSMRGPWVGEGNLTNVWSFLPARLDKLAQQESTKTRLYGCEVPAHCFWAHLGQICCWLPYRKTWAILTCTRCMRAKRHSPDWLRHLRNLV